MTQVGTVYGEALYSLARDKGLDEEIQGELTVLREAFSQSPDYIRLLRSPKLAKQERCEILDQAFRGKVQPYVLNFLKILVERDYIGQFADCCGAYTQLYHEAHNMLDVEVHTAVPLTQAQETALTEKLKTITGKTILLHNTVNPNALGGVRLSYDGKCLDDTVAGRLKRMGDLLKNTVL